MPKLLLLSNFKAIQNVSFLQMMDPPGINSVSGIPRIHRQAPPYRHREVETQLEPFLGLSW